MSCPCEMKFMNLLQGVYRKGRAKSKKSNHVARMGGTGLNPS